MGITRRCATIARSGLPGSLLSIALLGGACATKHQANWGEKPVVQDAATDDVRARAEQLVAEGDAFWARRDDKEQLLAAIAKWEAAAAAQLSAPLAAKLARAYFLLGDAHHQVEGDLKARDAAYQAGLDWATSALKLYAPAFAEARANGTKHVAALSRIGPDAAAALYWYAANLGRWAATKDFATKVAYKDDLKASMDRVYALDEKHFYAGPWRYFGGYEALTHGLAGGSLEKSKEAFEKAIALAPEYLGTKVVYAELLCPKLQKDENKDGEPDGKALFERLLNEVIQADVSALDPEVAPENRLEQRKAKKLLAQVDDLF